MMDQAINRCIFFCMCFVCVCSVVSDSETPWIMAHQAPLSMKFYSKNIGVGCHFLIQGIFPTQGLSPSILCLLQWQADSLPLHRLGSPYVCAYLPFFPLKIRQLYTWGFPGGTVVKNPPVSAGDTRGTGSIPGSGKIPWSRKWQPTPVLLPGKFHVQRSLVGYSPCGHKELYTTECVHTHTHTHTHTHASIYIRKQIRALES